MWIAHRLTGVYVDHAVTLIAATKSSSGSGLSFLILPALFIVGYLVLIRPQRTRQRQQLQMRNEIAPGVEVVTTAGLIATVVEVDDDAVTLEIAPGVHSRFLRQAIARVNQPPSPEPPEDEAVHDSDETPPETQQV